MRGLYAAKPTLQILAANCSCLPAANIRSMTARSRYVLFDDLQGGSVDGLSCKYEPRVQEALIEGQDKAPQKGGTSPG